MSDKLSDLLNTELNSRLAQEGYEVDELVAVPSGADRMVRFRTIQEVLNEFENSDDDQESQTYVLHVRKRREKALETAKEAQNDAIYLGNGKLNAGFLLNNAQLLFRVGDFLAARQIFTALTKSGECMAEALLGLARCLEAEGKTPAALRAYDDSILYAPSLDAFRRYAALLIRNQKDQQAAEVLERALLLKEVSQKMRYDLHQAAGNAWLRSGMPSKAERHYRKALEANPHSDAIAVNLGALCLGQKRYDEAKVAYEEAIRVNPRNDKAWFGMGSIAIAEGRRKEAHDAFAESLRLRIQQPQAIFHLVKCAYEIKEYATARDLLRAYVEGSPVNANLLYSLAGLEYHLGERDLAERTARTILQIQPDHAEAKKLLQLIGN